MYNCSNNYRIKTALHQLFTPHTCKQTNYLDVLLFVFMSWFSSSPFQGLSFHKCKS